MRDGDLLIGAVLIGGAAALVLTRKRAAPSDDAKHSGAGAASDRVQLLGLPIDGARLVTPLGHYGAARYVVGGESTGRRPSPDAPINHFHQAVDLQARPGANVYAVGDGLIITANPGLGKAVLKLQLEPRGTWGGDPAVLVSHVVYADLGDRLVQPGERVTRGQPIARVQPRGFVHFSTKRIADGAEEFFDPARAGFAYQRRALA